ncbi:chitin synthase III catalytic subunit, partial [Syncephalis plumigaleata]
MKFGKFDGICNQNALTVCPLLGEVGGVGLQPACYARNLEVHNTGVLIFQPAALFIRIVTIFMCGIMIFHISSKYTAVGRKEMVTFFYLFLLDTILSMLLISNIIPMAWQGYHYFVAIDFGLVVACFWCLMLNGFISFQFMEDGTRLSIWGVRISSFVIGLFSAFVAIATFENVAGFKQSNPILLWVMMYVFTGVCLLVYIVSQILLVFKTMRDRWPLGDIMFGVVFFAIGQIITIGIGETICNGTRHYLDGTFFGACSVLLAVMFIYKYWDSITKEDLEFSVGGKQNVWEVKD